MNKRTFYILYALSYFLALPLFGQNYKIEGQVVDLFSKEPLIEAQVELLNITPRRMVLSDSFGRFEIGGLRAGRYRLLVAAEGYNEIFIPDIILGAGQAVVLRINLQEQAKRKVEQGTDTESDTEQKRFLARETSVSANLSLLGQRSYTVNEVERFNGAREDPQRLAANFAGTRPLSDAFNELLIRAMPGAYTRYQVNGLPVQNVSHMPRPSANGGIFPLINQNLMANSELALGGGSAEYLNTPSGIFDVQLRAGNSNNFQLTQQTGIAGLELTIEGPLSKSKGSSFIASYRHAIFPLLAAMNLNLVPESPNYQDGHIKFDFPNTRTGDWSFFSTVGFGNSEITRSTIAIAPHQRSSTQWINGFAGLKHRISLSKSAYVQTTLGANYMDHALQVDTANADDILKRRHSKEYENLWLSLNTVLHKRLKNGHILRTGIIARQQQLLYTLQETRNNSFLIDYQGGDLLAQAFVQHYAQWSSRFSTSIGANVDYQSISGQIGYSPRLALNYALNSQHQLSMGLLSQTVNHPLYVYFQRSGAAGEERNRKLENSLLHQAILSYKYRPATDWSIRLEGYYYLWQKLLISSDPNEPIVLNDVMSLQMTNVNPALPAFQARGNGRQWGTELTVEKYFSKNYYLMFAANVFDVKYQNIRGDWNNSTFNNRYIFTLLGGKEFVFNKEKGNAITLDTRLFYSGGYHYTPIDLPASEAVGYTIYNFDNYMGARGEDQFRIDVKLGVRFNTRRATHIFFFDLYNLLDARNRVVERYDFLNGGTYDWRNTGRITFITYRLRLAW